MNPYNEKNNFINKDSKELVDFIHNNIDNTELVIQEAHKVLSQDKLIKELLIFDLLNYSPKEEEKTNDMDIIISICVTALKKYQNRAGGYNIEDIDWIPANKESKRFKIKPTEKVLYNSVRKKHYDTELVWFLDSILEHVKKYILDDVLKANIKYKIEYDERNCVCWVVFLFLFTTG